MITSVCGAVSDVIRHTLESGGDVFYTDTLSLAGAMENSGDIHYIYRYVKRLSPDNAIHLDTVRNFAVPFELTETELQWHYDAYYEQECYGLYSRNYSFFLNQYTEYLCNFDFKTSEFPELYHFALVLHRMLGYFFSYGIYQLSMLCYLSALAAGDMHYSDDCFRSFYLIDASEAPDDTEAIKHFSLDVNNGFVRLIFNDRKAALQETFTQLLDIPEVIQYLRKKFPQEAINAMNKDISAILSQL